MMPRDNIAEADNWWMIEAVDILDWENRYSHEAPFLQVGWIRMPGFDLVDMSTEIWYGESSDIPADVAVHFTSSMDISEPGAEVILYGPSSIKLDCDAVDTPEPELRTLALPALWDPVHRGQDYVPCRADMTGKWIALRLNASLPMDTYVFTVRIQTPVIDPPSEQNVWSLWLKDVHGNIIETAVDLRGQRILYGARAATPVVEWAPIALLATTFYVTIGLEVLDEFALPTAALLVQLPMMPGRRHAIQEPHDLRILKARGPGLPLASGTWSDTSDPHRILVYLDPNQRLRSGLYGISFPVHVLTPEEEWPRFNVWQLAICSSRNLCSVGTKLSDRGEVITVYAMGGFSERDTIFSGDKPVWEEHKFVAASSGFRFDPWLVLLSSILLGLN
jgi:hypothetical protein